MGLYTQSPAEGGLMSIILRHSEIVAPKLRFQDAVDFCTYHGAGMEAQLRAHCKGLLGTESSAVEPHLGQGNTQ